MQDFLQFMADLRQGAALEEYRKALVELQARVNDTGKRGSMTITLTIEPVAKLRNTFSIKDAVTTKLPVGEKGETLLFADDSGRLSRRDPRQPELPTMRTVEHTRPAAPEQEEPVAINE